MPTISRRHFLGFAAAALVVRRGTFGVIDVPSVPTDLDHILLGANDLDRGIAWIEERSGVRAILGGVHPGRGTRNALLSLGPRRYLEIIAPDPQQAGSAASREPWAARLNAFKEPHIINWAAHTDDLAAIAQKATAADIAIENPREGSRARPDGKILRWKSFGLKEDFDGVLPFFIEWSTDSIHPSQDAPAGCTLQHFFVKSPDAKDVRSVASKLGLNLDARPGRQPLLSARITGKKGEFELS